MSEIIMTDEQLSDLGQQLIAATPPKGPIGNSALRDKLGWDEERYWFVRKRLLEDGVLGKGRGRGGSVIRVVPAIASDAVSPTSEKDLYDPIVATLIDHWAEDHQIQRLVIECTAKQGRRDTGGKWTRPDVTLASFNLNKFVAGKRVELNTFEIKTADGLDVTAVYEALAHRRAAHYAYVIACIPESERTALNSLLDRLYADASEHGIGLILVGNVADYKTWSFEIEPMHHEPDPSDLDNFIRIQTSAAFQDRILSWHRIL